MTSSADAGKLCMPWKFSLPTAWVNKLLPIPRQLGGDLQETDTELKILFIEPFGYDYIHL